jgi:hypothetical protein
MNDQTEHLDQSEEDILTYAVSDEAIEAAADIGWGTTPLCTSVAVPCQV